MNKEYVFLGRMQQKTRDYIKNLERENRMLEHNWNELKKYIKEDSWTSVNGEITSRLILLKMQELEEGGNNEK